MSQSERDKEIVKRACDVSRGLDKIWRKYPEARDRLRATRAILDYIILGKHSGLADELIE